MDDMFDRIELKLRWYGSKYVVKYPRCSLRRQSTYADAQEDPSQVFALASVWFLIFVFGSSVCLLPILYTVNQAYQLTYNSSEFYISESSTTQIFDVLNCALFMLLGFVIGCPIATASARALKGLWRNDLVALKGACPNCGEEVFAFVRSDQNDCSPHRGRCHVCECLLEFRTTSEREKEKLHEKIINLQQQLEDKQYLELKMEQLKGQAQVMEHMKRDAETKEKMDEIDRELQETEEALQDLEDLTQTLIIKERNSNDELQDARKELITGLSKETRSARATIGVKSMGALDPKVFEKAAKEKYPSENARTKAEELMAMCRSHIEDHDWHPFKHVTVHGVLKEVIKEDDERLQSLKNDLGEEAWRAMITAMSELNEYNPSGKYPVLELWHLKEERKATLKEGADFILNKWRNQKRLKR